MKKYKKISSQLAYNPTEEILTGEDPSPTFCAYPWHHSYQGCRYERKLCCISEDAPLDTKLTTKKWWNGEYMKTVRRKMLKGKEVAECHNCYRDEKLGISSLREQCNSQQYKHFDDWLENTNKDGSVTNKVRPTFYDYRTIHCNLQCVSCGEAYSSTWQNLNEDMFDIEPKFKPDYVYEETMAKEIIHGLNSKTTKFIYWAGGEPFMQPLHWKVIEHMTELHKMKGYTEYIEDVTMFYNTNLTKNKWKQQSVPEAIRTFQPQISASLDGVYETLEWTRDGAKWEDIDKHWKQFYSLLNDKQKMSVATVTSAPVILDIKRYLEYFGPSDPQLFPAYLFQPNYKDFVPQTFLDIKLYPPDIFYPAIETALQEIRASGLRGIERWIQILEGYITEYKKQDFNGTHVDGKSLARIKKHQTYRERFHKTKRSLIEVYSVTNPAASEWLKSIIPEAGELDYREIV